MQFAALALQAGWHALLGWAFIVAGLILAGCTLMLGRPKAGAAHILRAYRPAEWSARRSTHDPIRPLDDTSQWGRVAGIVEKGLLQVETIVALQRRASSELEAVDDGLVQLLAEYKPEARLPITEAKALPSQSPAPVPAALAA